MTPEEFEDVVDAAMLELPEDLRVYADECMIFCRARANKAQRRSVNLPPDHDLFGLYEGRTLHGRSHDVIADLPPRVHLFWEPMLRACHTREELIHQIQKTFLHEIGHHFGLSEERLEELGYA